VLKTSLPRDAELELMKALHGDNPDSLSWTQSSAGSRPEPVRVHAKAPRRALSERQRPALRELVHLEARHLRERAAAVGVAGQERPAADRPGEAARRVGELARAASYLQAELLRPVTCKLSCCVPLNKQLCRLIEKPGNRVPSVLTACTVPPRETRSSWLTGSPGTTSTNRPAPLRTPVTRSRAQAKASRGRYQPGGCARP